MKAIMAMSENRAIGKSGGIPWSPIKNDFKWFKEFTLGKNIVVGHSTFQTLPPLKGRNIYFISRPKPITPNDIPVGDYNHHVNAHGTVGRRICYYQEVIYGQTTVDMMTGYESQWQMTDPVIAGGAKMYELFLPYITEFYVTHIKGSYDADTFMPPFEHLFSKQEVVKEFDEHKVVKYTKSL